MQLINDVTWLKQRWVLAAKMFLCLREGAVLL